MKVRKKRRKGGENRRCRMRNGRYGKALETDYERKKSVAQICSDIS